MKIKQGVTFRFFYIGLILVIIGIILITAFEKINIVSLTIGGIMVFFGILLFLSPKTMIIDKETKMVTSKYNMLFFKFGGFQKKLNSNTIIILRKNHHSKNFNYRSVSQSVKVNSCILYIYFSKKEKIEVKEWKDSTKAELFGKKLAKETNLPFSNYKP